MTEPIVRCPKCGAESFALTECPSCGAELRAPNQVVIEWLDDYGGRMGWFGRITLDGTQQVLPLWGPSIQADNFWLGAALYSDGRNLGLRMLCFKYGARVSRPGEPEKFDPNSFAAVRSHLRQLAREVLAGDAHARVTAEAALTGVRDDGK